MRAFQTEEGKREVANAVAAFPKRLVSGLVVWSGLVWSGLVVWPGLAWFGLVWWSGLVSWFGLVWWSGGLVVWPGLVLSDLVVERLVLDTVFVTFGMQ